MKRKKKSSKNDRIAALMAIVAAATVFVAVGVTWQALRGETGAWGKKDGSAGAESEVGSGSGESAGAAAEEGKESGSSGGESAGVAAEEGRENGIGGESAGAAAGEGKEGESAGAGGEEGKENGSGSGENAGAGAGEGKESGSGGESAGTAAEEGRENGSGNLGTDTAAVENLLAEMTLEEKVYQLFVVYPSAVTGVRKVTSAGEKTKRGLEKYPVGGLIYDKSNMVSKEQVREMLENVQTYTKIPLILTCDEEGGRVSRLMSTVGTTQIGPMFEYREEGVSAARENAGIIAGDLKALGFNMDLAPVADVWSNPENTVIGDRAYSDDFLQAAELVAAAVAGFREGGVACTLKHFPGHGDTSADSHYGSVYVYKTLDELRAQELLPFQAGIDAGADAVMMGHLIIAEVEEEPALFSWRLVTELLREEMGFQGVVMTDGLQMEAMTDYYSSGEIAVKAVKAGVDMLLCPKDLEEAADALIRAVESGEISEERLDESVRRILTLKKERGIL